MNHPLENHYCIENVAHYGNEPSSYKKLDFFNRPIEWLPLSKLRENLNTTIYISNAATVVDLSSIDTQIFKCPLKIKTLFIDGKVTEDQIDAILSPLFNLKSLHIHISSLVHINLKNLKLHLSSLESLQINSEFFTSESKEEIEKIIANASALINLPLPSLNYLAVSVPILSQTDSIWTQSIIHSLLKNNGRIKYLSIESPFFVANKISSIKNFALNTKVNEFKIAEECYRKLQSINLTSFHYFASEETESSEFWKKTFSESQKSLVYYQFWIQSCKKISIFPTNLLEKLVRANKSTLETLSVNNLEINESERISGNAFQICSKLKTLFLKGCPTSKKTSLFPSFEHFNLFPYSLQIIKLHNITLSLSDTKFIGNNLQELCEVDLLNIGETGNLGMSFETVHTLLSKKKMRKIEIVGGINRKSLENHQLIEETKNSNGVWKNMTRILLKRQLLTQSYISFKAIRDENGVFDLISEAETDFSNAKSSSSSSSSDDSSDELNNSSTDIFKLFELGAKRSIQSSGTLTDSLLDLNNN